MSNFEFLKQNKEYELFADAAIEAENIYATSPAMCAIGCRKALELAVKWVYSVDTMIKMPYKDNLQSLIHEPTFRFELDPAIWGQLPLIIKLGNAAVHTSKSVAATDAIVSLTGLFDFIEWIDYCYGSSYEARAFDEKSIPTVKKEVDEAAIRERDSLIKQKDSEIEALRAQLEALAEAKTAKKSENKTTRHIDNINISEFETRKRYIDVDLKLLGWKLDGADKNVLIEYPVNDMDGVVGQKGKIDYVLMGDDGLPLAIIEAKKTCKDPLNGYNQAILYAECLERENGRWPLIFLSNGFETYYMDNKGSKRLVSGFFKKSELEKLINRRGNLKKLNTIVIDDKITDRYYQKEAIRAACEHIEEGFRKALLVMATGTGKTRVAASLADVLSRGGYATNILFLADRTALVKQAKDAFKEYLPDMSLCNLCDNKDDINARIIFSTYPTMLNAIDERKMADGLPMFGPAHFDLIIVDESHRSIFNKYKFIFEYFDAMCVGLTATPREGVDANTYAFFEMENKVPTYAYDYETAVGKDHVLVPYYNYEVDMKFREEGIVYDDLSDEDKDRYEDDFAEDDYIPPEISSSKLNKFVFNEDTTDKVLQDLMERGIKIGGGDRIGKTIIFAQNKRHAQFIVDRFYALYPQQIYSGFTKRIICEDSYAQNVIEDFKNPDKYPYIAVSVDMMDTGVDVPECVNLVFFKAVKSKIKFHQMIGRGTRLCPNLMCVDGIDGAYDDKKRFLIFDYCGNFEFFRENINGYETENIRSLSEDIYRKQIDLIAALQDGRFADEEHQKLRHDLVIHCNEKIQALFERENDIASIRHKREYIERYKDMVAFDFLSDTDRAAIDNNIAPIVIDTEKDDAAKAFDNTMYGLMLSAINATPAYRVAKSRLITTAEELKNKHTIPQVNAKLTLINRIMEDDFWSSTDIISYEQVRTELRDLMQFLRTKGPNGIIKTMLNDPVLREREGIPLEPAYDFEDYRKKVGRYVEEHGNNTAIYKIKHNIPLSQPDYNELERVLTTELGDADDYKREFGDTPFGLLIRKIAKLDHEAAMEAFSDFINDESLNAGQIAFVNKIIAHVENNGYMENISDLQKPPFDRPVSFIKVFDIEKRKRIIDTINDIKNNAMVMKA